MNDSIPRNVLGEPLTPCCTTTRTGFWRDGYCRTGPQDVGRHVVCAVVTDAFLEFSRARGNDLVTPMPRRWRSSRSTRCAGTPSRRTDACPQSRRVASVAPSLICCHGVELRWNAFSDS